MSELTKIGEIHHHVLAGPVEGRIRCYGAQFSVVRYKARLSSCSCLSHALGCLWLDITGDSYIVHATPVLSHSRTAAYLSKYLSKGVEDRGELERRGFKRRWSSSRGYPGGGRLRLAATEDPGWVSRVWKSDRFEFPRTWDGKAVIAEHKEGGPADLLVRTGEDLTLLFVNRRAARILARQAGGVQEISLAAGVY